MNIKSFTKFSVGLTILVLLCAYLAWFTPSQFIAQGQSPTATPRAEDVLSATPTAEDRLVSARERETPFLFHFASPRFIILVWPGAFVLLSIFLNTLAQESDGLHARGSQKYSAECVDANGKPYLKAHLDMAQLKALINGTDEVQEIKVLKASERVLEWLSIGVDLCIAAISTDLSIIFTVYATADIAHDIKIESMIAGISLIIMHFVLASMVIIIVKKSKKFETAWARSLSVQSANLVGIFAIYSSFYILGDYIIN
ncbi:MAG: hypothetical protein ACPGWR_21725 [Ardenticatenaceae bacterium]